MFFIRFLKSIWKPKPLRRYSDLSAETKEYMVAKYMGLGFSEDEATLKAYIVWEQYLGN